MRINFVTIFPEFFGEALSFGIPARAQAKGLVDCRPVDLREFTTDRHRTVDDLPYGGGAGMVMKPEPFFRAVEAARTAGPVVLLSARGRVFSQEDARRYAIQPELTLLCGHYKDVDERVAKHLATEELSLGDFVLSGGEAAAVCVAGRGRPPPPRGARRPRIRLDGLLLRRAASRRALLDPASGVPGAPGAGGPPLRGSRPDRGVPGGGGRAPHAGEAPGSLEALAGGGGGVREAGGEGRHRSKNDGGPSSHPAPSQGEGKYASRTRDTGCLGVGGIRWWWVLGYRERECAGAGGSIAEKRYEVLNS